MVKDAVVPFLGFDFIPSYSAQEEFAVGASLLPKKRHTLGSLQYPA